MNCPKCDELMERQEYDPSVGLEGGWFCEACDEWVHETDVDWSDE